MYKLTIDNFSYVIENNITPKAVLSKILSMGSNVQVSQKHKFADTVVCKVGGHVVGYLSRSQHIWLATQLDRELSLYAKITDVQGRSPKSRIQITVSTEPVGTESIRHALRMSKKQFSDFQLGSTDLHSLKHRPDSKKHRLTGIGFYPHGNLETTVKRQRGKTGIYCIYNKDFKTYVGQSKDIGSRWCQHLKMLENGCHHNPTLQADWLILGVNAYVFKVVAYCETWQLDDYEKACIEQLSVLGNVYNATPDGQAKLPEDCLKKTLMSDSADHQKCLDGNGESGVIEEPSLTSSHFAQAVQNIIDENLGYQSLLILSDYDESYLNYLSDHYQDGESLPEYQSWFEVVEKPHQYSSKIGSPNLTVDLLANSHANGFHIPDSAVIDPPTDIPGLEGAENHTGGNKVTTSNLTMRLLGFGAWFSRRCYLRWLAASKQEL